MRSVTNPQLLLGQTDISQIEFDLNSRDEIPKLLRGLQHIRCSPAWDEIEPLLESITPAGVDANNGRQGMLYWNLMVLANLRLNCDWNFDTLKEMTDHHRKIREMLGLPDWDRLTTYSLQTIKDNVALLTPELVQKINQVLVRHSLNLFPDAKQPELNARCDSFVVRTNVEYPTDIGLLFDAVSGLIRLVSKLCADHQLPWWRQHHKNFKDLKKTYRRAQKLGRSKAKQPAKQAERDQAIEEAYLAYLELAAAFMIKADATVTALSQVGQASPAVLLQVESYITHAERQIEQIHSRVIMGEKIPHHEKVFSIFEEHTEWIVKGKAGCPQELGLRVCIVESRQGFILHHQVMQQQTDDQVTVSIIAETKEQYPELAGCSFDKGFHSKPNQERLKDLLDRITLPKKGKLSAADKEREYDATFQDAKRQHSAVESAIGALQNHGLDVCPDRGLDAFHRYVAIGILARNLQILGHKLQLKEKKRRQRTERYRRTWNENRAEEVAACYG